MLAFLSTPLAQYADGCLYTPADISQEFQLLRVADGHHPGNNLLSDLFVQMHPWVLFNRDELRAGRIPLWNPYNGGGVPHLANYQSAVFSPFSVPFYVLPLREALLASAFAKLFLLAFFTFLFLSEIGLSFWPSVLGGTAFAFSGHNVFLLGFPHPAAAITLPAGLFFLERFFRCTRDVNGGYRPQPDTRSALVGFGTSGTRSTLVGFGTSGGRAALVGFATTLCLGLLAGQPEPFYFALVMIAAYATARLAVLWWTSARDRRATWSIASLGVLIATTATIAAGLAAFQLLPFFEYLAQSRVLEQRSVVQTPLLPAQWPLAWFPDLLGNPSTAYQIHGQLPQPNFETANLHYVGALVLFLALVSLVFVTKRLVHVFFAVGAVVWYLYAHDIGGCARLVAHLPSFERAPLVRSQALWSFSIAICAAFGLEALLTLEKRRRWSAFLIAAAAVLLAFVFVRGAERTIESAYDFVGRLPGRDGFDREAFRREGPLHVRSMLTLFGAGTLALVVLAFVHWRAVRNLCAFSVVIAAFAASGWHYRNYNPVSEERFVFPRTQAIEEIARTIGDEPILFLGLDGIPPAANLPYRLRTIASYDAMWVADYDRLYRDLLGDDDNWRPTRRLSRRALQLFGVQYVFARGAWLPSDTVFSFAAYDISALYESAEILPGSEVVQEFTATENELQALSLRIGTQLGQRGGELRLSLEDPADGRVIAEDSVDCDAFDASHRVSLHIFAFDPIVDSRDRTFRLRIRCPAGVPGKAPTVWCRRDYRTWQNRALWRATRSRRPIDDATAAGEHPDLVRWRALQGREPLEGGLWFDMSFSLGDYERVATVAGSPLYRSRRSCGRYRTVGRASVAPSLEKAWDYVHHPAFDPLHAVILNGVDPAFVTSHQGEVSDEGRRIEVLEEVPGHVRLRVDRDTPGWLVLSQPWYPGWKARVGGVERSLSRANYAFAALPVDAGSNVVELDYEPARFSVGLAISGASLALGLFLCLAPTLFAGLSRGGDPKLRSKP